MPSMDKSPEDRYSSGQQIQKRAGRLLEALLDHAEQVRRFGNDFEKADIQVTLPNSRSNGSGLKFKVRRNFLAKLSGISTENLTPKESKQIYDKVRSVVDCLKKFGIISYYFPQNKGWDLILPDGDKGKLLKYFSDACNNWEAEKVAKSVKAPWAEIRNYVPSGFEVLEQQFFDMQGQRGESRILKLRMATWSLIIQGNYIERDQQGEALEIAKQLAKLPEISLWLIRGEPGAGKTALMRWLTYELFRCGCLILEKKAQDEDSGWLEQLREFSEQIGEKHFYVIADDLFRDKSILDELEQSQVPFPFTLLGTTRLNEDQHESLEGRGYQIKILDIKRPSKAEKKRILEQVCQETEVKARLDNIVAEDKKRLMDAPAMLVLMLQLSEGKPFKQIIADIIKKDLPSTEQRPVYQVFGVICSFSQYGIAVPQEVVPLCISNYPIETIQDVVDRAEIVELAGLVETNNKSGHKHLRTIHELVAKTAMEPYRHRSNDNPPYPCRSLERHLKSIMAQADAIPATHKGWISYTLRLLVINGEADLVRQLVREFSDQIQFLQHQIGITAWFSWAEVYRLLGLLDEQNHCTSIILSSQPKNSSEWIDWLSLVEKRGTKQQKQESLIQLAAWLQEYPEDFHLHRRYFKMIERYYKTVEQKQKAINLTAALLEKHRMRRYVQISCLKLVEDFGITEQKRKAINLTAAWLQQYPNDCTLLIKNLTLVEKEGTPEQRQKTIDRIATWLQQQSNEQHVRTKYLTLLEKHGTEQQRKEVIDQTATWLEEHQDDKFVRTKYLTLVEKHGTEQQREEAIDRSFAWLEEHQDDKFVRAKYLIMVEKCGTSGQKHKAIDQTANWLPKHIDNIDIRKRYFRLVEEYGTFPHEQEANRIYAQLKEHSDNQKQKEIEQQDAWLQKHP
jgi:hypothetical protein